MNNQEDNVEGLDRTPPDEVHQDKNRPSNPDIDENNWEVNEKQEPNENGNDPNIVVPIKKESQERIDTEKGHLKQLDSEESNFINFNIRIYNYWKGFKNAQFRK